MHPSHHESLAPSLAMTETATRPSSLGGLRRGLAYAGLSLLCLTAAAACSAGPPLQVVVPTELEVRADHLPVEGRGNTGVLVDESFTYGEWTVDDVRRGPRIGRPSAYKQQGWPFDEIVRNWSSLLRYGRYWDRTIDDRDYYVEHSRGFQFAATREGVRWEGECDSRLDEAPGGPQHEQLRCALSPVDSDELWVLMAELREEWRPEEAFEIGGTQLEGILTDDESSFLLGSTGRVRDVPIAIGLAGYIFTEDQRSIAAVQALEDGAVWLPQEEDPQRRDALAAAAAALLLYQPLENEV
ncbi:MAG: hypothetical protein AAGD01_15645 [Acidobacteriota bacterium]